MNDLISRAEAIEALFELYEYQRDIDPTEAADLVRQGIYLAEKKIEHLPSAERRGKWERVRNDDNGYDFRCSSCHRFRFHNGELRRYKYCPNCGATMEGEE